MFKTLNFLFLFIPFLMKAQAIYPDEILVCDKDSVVLITGTYPNNLGIDFSEQTKGFSIDSLSDDMHTGIINIGFNFEYFGTTYTQCVISTNGYVSFNTTLAGTFSPWAINSPLPNALETNNAIHGVYTDVLPTTVTQEIDITYVGAAPNRVMIITWDNIPMFSFPCLDQCFYSSILLFEGSNEIVNTVGQVETCIGWNDGIAVQGLVDQTGSANSIFTIDPTSGLVRNHPNTFTSNGDAVKYTPSGNTYTYQFIPYTPVGLPTWYDRNGVLLGQGYSIPVVLPPVDSLPYEIKAINEICDQYYEDSVLLVYGGPEAEITEKYVSCLGDTDGEIEYFLEGGENEDWTIILMDIDSNIIDQYQGDNLPITFSNLPRGLYYIEGTSPSTCPSTSEILIGIAYSQPKVHADLINPICHGENSGRIEFSPHGGFNSDWIVKVSNDAGTISQTYTANDVPINLDGLEGGTYTVTVESPTTCLDTFEYILKDPDMFRFVYESYDHNNCGVLTSFMDFPVTGGRPPYKFEINGEKVIDLKKQPLENKIYTIVATDAGGCQLTRELDIQDRHEPIVDFIMPAEVNLEDGVVEFTDISIANDHANLESWFWEFGDFGTSNERHPSHVYKEIGVYKVFLFVSDDNGCHSFMDKEINVITPELFLPNVFTPNGDGNNEIFKPVISRISDKDYEMRIADRWGRVMFKTNNIHEGWDGRDDKGYVIEGSYVWIINYTDEFGYVKKVDGTVVLVK